MPIVVEKEDIGMKKISVVALSAVMAVGSCFGTVYTAGSKETIEPETTEEVEESEEEKKPSKGKYTVPFSFEDLEWAVEQGVQYGERMILNSYTNNTDCDILDLYVTYTRKDGVTDEQMVEAFPEEREENDGWYTDEEIADFEIYATNHAYTRPGEFADPSELLVDATTELTTEEQLSLFDPDIAEITYLDGDKLYVAYYDFVSGKISCDPSRAIDAHRWSDSDLAKLIPEPDYEVVTIDFDDDDYFSFDFRGVSMDDFNDFKNACIEAGFTENVECDYEEWYEAYNKDGVELDLEYSDNSRKIGGFIKIEEKESE